MIEVIPYESFLWEIHINYMIHVVPFHCSSLLLNIQLARGTSVKLPQPLEEQEHVSRKQSGVQDPVLNLSGILVRV